MRLRLKKLTIKNFKGIKHIEIDFHHETDIFGDNAECKTTVVDAFHWLSFGKNSEGETKFSIKPIKKGTTNFIKDIEVEVEAIFDVDGVEESARKKLVQKWTTKRGSLKEEYTGDENKYYWNNVPLKESEFKVKIQNVIDEGLFRLITNPFHFNSLHWTERRKILVGMGGKITTDEILALAIKQHGEDLFINLKKAFAERKTVDDYKKQLAEQYIKIKKDAESIPFRIDELNKSLPEELGFDAILTNINQLNTELSKKQSTASSITSRLAEEQAKLVEDIKGFNKKLNDANGNVYKIKTSMQTRRQQIELQVKEESSKTEAEIKKLETDLTAKKTEIKNEQDSLEKYKESLASIAQSITEKETRVHQKRTEYNNLGATQFQMGENEGKCPTCLQDLPADKLEEKKTELQATFNKNKLAKLKEIEGDAISYKKEIEALHARETNGKNTIDATEKKIASIQQHITDIETKLVALRQLANQPHQDIALLIKQALDADNDYQNLSVQLENAELNAKNIEASKPTEEKDSTESKPDEKLQLEIKTMLEKLGYLQQQYSNKEKRETTIKRIQELTDEETNLAQKLAENEGNMHAIMLYSKAHMSLVDTRINSNFKYVKFKMFNELVNGGTEETCETLVSSNGAYVTFSNANNAARINAGIDIINALCNYYNVYAPIFIDNRESVTKLIHSESQIVNLFVTEGAELSVGTIKYKSDFSLKSAALV